MNQSPQNQLNGIQGPQVNGGGGDMLTGVQSVQRDSKNAILGKYKSNASSEFMTSLGPSGGKMAPQMMTQMNGMNPMGMNPQMGMGRMGMNPQMNAQMNAPMMGQMNPQMMGRMNQMNSNMMGM